MSDKNKQARVLIVDDEPHILMALEFLIKQKGYQLQKAENGHEALQIIEQFKPNIAILDVMMPEMDGFELARIIRSKEEYADITILFLTAKGTQADRFHGYETGAEIYMTKPFDNDELMATLEELLTYG